MAPPVARHRQSRVKEILIGKSKISKAASKATSSKSGKKAVEAKPTIPDPIYFYSARGEYGFMSNWYQKAFFSGGMKFRSSEHYIMYKKAVHFKDWEIANQALAAVACSGVKALGGRIKNFDSASWAGVREDIAAQGLFLKFQDKQLKDKLLGTGDKLLVETSAKDAIWGIGMNAAAARKSNQAEWGLNIQGKALMRVRSAIKEGRSVKDEPKVNY